MRKKLVILVSVVLAALLLVGALALPALAQDPTPQPKTPSGWHSRGFGFGRGISGQAELEAAAKALGMTAEELSTQLWGGRTLADLADKAGVELQAVRDAVEAARTQALKDAIAQAVKDGNLTQQQANWLLQGMELGFMPGRWGFGHGIGKGFGFAPTQPKSAAPSSSS